jgi:hypothetical protein
MNILSVRLFKSSKLAQREEEFVSHGTPSDLTARSSYLEMDPFNVYPHDGRSGLIALTGVFLSILFSIICISLGIYISQYRHTLDDVAIPPSWRNTPFLGIHVSLAGVVAFLPSPTATKSEILSFIMNLIVTICTESIGFVHSVTLKSALAAESRLDCNTNLRLLTAASRNPWTNPNGAVFNVIMALLLIISYASSTLTFMPLYSLVSEDATQEWCSTSVYAVPVLMLGFSLFLQAIIAITGVIQARVLTWSSAPLETTAALLHHGLLTPISGRCMHDVLHSASYLGPRLPSKRQPSAWQSHPNTKKIIIVLWCLSFAYGLWGGLVVLIWSQVFKQRNSNPGVDSWAILPNLHSNAIAFGPSSGRGIPPSCWILVFGSFIVLQGSLTMGLHCSEVIADVVRDEGMWRRATTTAGAQPSKNALLMALQSWPNVVLLVAKPVLRE